MYYRDTYKRYPVTTRAPTATPKHAWHPFPSTAEVIDRDGFRESLTVRGSFDGAAPIALGRRILACKDRDGEDNHSDADEIEMLNECHVSKG